MSDILEALTTGETVEAGTPEPAAEEDGWTVARSMVQERVGLWCVAAGLKAPVMPDVDTFADVDAILAALQAIRPDTSTLTPDDRSLGLVLAQATQLGPLRAVEVALDHVQYEPAQKARLCRVNTELDRLLYQLASLAVARHFAIPDGSALFDLSPWEDATASLAAELEAQA
jgi:hypothetical protein